MSPASAHLVQSSIPGVEYTHRLAVAPGQPAFAAAPTGSQLAAVNAITSATSTANTPRAARRMASVEALVPS
jgi:hypothetical protein